MSEWLGAIRDSGVKLEFVYCSRVRAHYIRDEFKVCGTSYILLFNEERCLNMFCDCKGNHTDSLKIIIFMCVLCITLYTDISVVSGLRVY